MYIHMYQSKKLCCLKIRVSCLMPVVIAYMYPTTKHWNFLLVPRKKDWERLSIWIWPCEDYSQQKYMHKTDWWQVKGTRPVKKKSGKWKGNWYNLTFWIFGIVFYVYQQHQLSRNFSNRRTTTFLTSYFIHSFSFLSF